MTSTAQLGYVPSFFDPKKAYANFTPDLAGAMREGIQFAKDRGLKSAQRLKGSGIAHMVMLTDLQNDFRDHGRLPVTGTDDVVLRACVRLINGTATDFFTGVTYSLDSHPHVHISFDHYWRDRDGKPLDLSQRGAACLTLEDEKMCVFRAYGFKPDGSIENIGYYQAHFDPRDSVEYWKHLQNTGQGDIWVFVPHCVLSSDGNNLHPLLEETIAFMSGARSLIPQPIFKGHIIGTDWFGPLMPCMPDTTHPQGGLQKDVVDQFKLVATVEFFGVAEDFCDYHMKRQCMEAFVDTEFLGKLRFVEDGTAPIIPNAAHVVKQNEAARRKGIKFIRHDTPLANSV